MAQKRYRFTLDVDTELMEDFRKECQKVDRTPTAQVRRLMAQWIRTRREKNGHRE